MTRPMLLVAVAALASAFSTSVTLAQSLQGSTDRAPEFTRGGGGCTQFGMSDPGRVSAEAANAASDVLVRLVMRRCVLEGVPVTSAEETRIAPLVGALSSGAVDALFAGPDATRAHYQQFANAVRPILGTGFDGERMRRVEINIATALRPSSDAGPVEIRPLITESRPQSGTEFYQPEFTRGPGCSVFGDTGNRPGASRETLQATSRLVLQSVWRRCVFQGVALTGAEDTALFPALRALADGAGPRQYDAMVAAARRTLDPTRAARVAGNIAEARRGMEGVRFPRRR